MRSFGAWDSEVLSHTFPHVDYISLHAYYHNDKADTSRYLARIDEFDRYICDMIAIVDAVLAHSSPEILLNISPPPYPPLPSPYPQRDFHGPSR